MAVIEEKSNCTYATVDLLPLLALFLPLLFHLFLHVFCFDVPHLKSTLAGIGGAAPALEVIGQESNAWAWQTAHT